MTPVNPALVALTGLLLLAGALAVVVVGQLIARARRKATWRRYSRDRHLS